MTADTFGTVVVLTFLGLCAVATIVWLIKMMWDIDQSLKDHDRDHDRNA